MRYLILELMYNHVWIVSWMWISDSLYNSHVLQCGERMERRMWKLEIKLRNDISNFER